jgi:hypothetical protein
VGAMSGDKAKRPYLCKKIKQALHPNVELLLVSLAFKYAFEDLGNELIEAPRISDS